MRWFESGVIPPAGSYDGYWADPYTLFFIEVVAMQFAELRRLQDFRSAGRGEEGCGRLLAPQVGRQPAHKPARVLEARLCL